MVHRPAATEKMSPSNSPGNPPAATSGSKSRAGANAEPPLRRLLPTSRPPARAGSEIEIPRRRRTYTTAACEACRKRKAKCNAERPSCAYCVNADIPCVYDTSARNETHSQALKRKFGELEARAAVYVELYELLQDRSDIESAEIFKRIRMGGPPESILRRIKEGDLLLQLSLKPEMRFRYVFPYVSELPAHLYRPDNPYIESCIYEWSALQHSGFEMSHAPTNAQPTHREARPHLNPDQRAYILCLSMPPKLLSHCLTTFSPRSGQWFAQMTY
ncbi:hypothetical protein QC764_0087870 [Podospora pseudoanserina]|uniref:Zn(2)-C6 fungal-type domain-containing protein n=1 Tax=Podospora pseudoanserina TaxID=2609844 RepID=A0ABR0HRK0_9PEZI|nr:hypothetical protein QC764_0087870 [Podospora pseudoanserina]